MIRRLAALALAPFTAVPASAQDHSMHGGHAMPADTTPAVDHGGHAMPKPAGEAGTALPAGDAPAPSPPRDHYADRLFPPAEMARARARMMRESGGRPFAQIMFNLAEYQARRGRDGYRWDGEAWFGSDIDRLTLKTEGEGSFRDRIDQAEVQALYSRAIGPYFNLQAGLRHDVAPRRATTYAALGIEGLAPYWFEVEAALFLSQRGDLLARIEGYYDQRITQRLVLQPRVELELAAQDVAATRTGAGLSSAEAGLRLRYEITRRFAPYVGVSHDAKFGRSARYARIDGEDPTRTSVVAGVRIWF